MRIEIGQDALGRWAWMIIDDSGVCAASDEDYREASLAMEEATNQMRLLEKRVRRKAGAW